MTPMLRTFAPSAVTPPSANTNACVGEHHRHHQAGEPRPEQDRRQRGAQEVAAGAAGDGEVEHLGREDERRGHAEQRDPPLVERRGSRAAAP